MINLNTNMLIIICIIEALFKIIIILINKIGAISYTQYHEDDIY